MATVIKTKIGAAVLEVTAGSPKVAFAMLGAFSEILADTRCGLCKGTDLGFEYRRVGDGGEFDYYSRRCLNPACRAQLDFGQHKTGETLFGKRRGNREATGGWYQWTGNRDEDEGKQRHPADDGDQRRGGGAGGAREEEDMPFLFPLAVMRLPRRWA